MLFRQLFDQGSSTYTYILADAASRKAVVIDPVLEQRQRDSQIIAELELQVLYLIETHVHADHITGGGLLKQHLGGQFVAGAGTKLSCADLLLEDTGVLTFGEHELKALATPGHTDGCTSWYTKGLVFTGDALLIRGCGRTDFQQGSSKKLYESVRNQLFTLPKETLVYPAHDYQGRTVSSIHEEICYNPRLKEGISESEFIKIMDTLDLPKPKKIDIAVPGNMRCGV